MNETPKIPPAKRTCERCEFWEDGYCQNGKSPHAYKHSGAGWSCDLWKINEELRKEQP